MRANCRSVGSSRRSRTTSTLAPVLSALRSGSAYGVHRLHASFGGCRHLLGVTVTRVWREASRCRGGGVSTPAMAEHHQAAQLVTERESCAWAAIQRL